MPDVEFLGHIQPAVSHSSKPSLILTGLDQLARIERVSGPRVIIGPNGRVVMEKLLSSTAALDWAMSEEARSPKVPLSDYRVMRAMSTAATAAILNLKDLYDSIPIILDCHIAKKRNQICGHEGASSLKKLLDDLNNRSGKLLPKIVIDELRALEESFSKLREVRSDITHYGGYLSPRIFEGKLYLLPLKYKNSVGHVNLWTRNTEESLDASAQHIVLKPFVLNFLAKWFAFWRNIQSVCSEAAEQASAEPCGRLVIASDYVSLFYQGFLELELANGMEFIWPCRPNCAGAVGICPNDPGTADAYLRWFNKEHGS